MEWKGLWFTTHKDVYEPGDDSFMLADAVAAEVRSGERFLEIGCGTGIVALAAAKKGAVATCTDVNPEAVALARANAKQNGLDVEVVESDLLDGVTGPFDVIAFNPPYLPTGPDDHVEGPLDLAFDGGPSGNDVVMRFVEHLERLETLPRCVLVVHSDLADPAPLEGAMAGLGFRLEEVAKERFFFEELRVVGFRRDA